MKAVLKNWFWKRPLLPGALLSSVAGIGASLLRTPSLSSVLTYTGGAAILLSGPYLVMGCGVFLPVRRWRRTAFTWIGTAFLLFLLGLLFNFGGLLWEDVQGSSGFFQV